MQDNQGRWPLTIAFLTKREAERARQVQVAKGRRDCVVRPVTGLLSGQRLYVVFGRDPEAVALEDER